MPKAEQPVSERIKFLLNTRANGNKSELGRAAGVSGQAIADLIGGKKGGPSFPVLQKMLRAFPDINPTWLIFGEGDILNPSTPLNKNSLSSAATVSENKGLRKQDVVSARFVKGNHPTQQVAATNSQHPTGHDGNIDTLPDEAYMVEPSISGDHRTGPITRLQVMVREERNGKEVLRWVEASEFLSML